MNIKSIIKPQHKNAFTLIELLIVVLIIAILAGTIVAVINPEKQRARVRDATRQKDLQVLSLALEQFYSEKNYYPEGPYSGPSTSLTTSLVMGPPSYLKAAPSEPGGAGFSYCYYACTATGTCNGPSFAQNYVLCAVQETSTVVGSAPDGTFCNVTPSNLGRYCISNPL